MPKIAIDTKSAPSAIGPYSQAIVCDGVLYCSGQIPLDPVTGEMIVGSVEDQTHRVLKNLGEVLSAGGADFSKVLKTTIYLKNMSDFTKVNQIYGQYFSEPYPARVTIQAAELPKNSLVEIDAVAKV